MATTNETPNIVRRGEMFLHETWDELLKVNWSTKNQLKQATKVVIFGSLIMGVYLGLVDVAFSYILNWFLTTRG